MKKSIIIILTAVLCINFLLADEAKEDTKKANTKVQDEKSEKTKGKLEVEWLTDFEKAKAESGKSGKPILALFTGSDWCGWCIALHDEVLKTEDFKKYAGGELILFEADFPRGRKMSKKVREQNQKLAKKYGIRGFPTVMLLDAKGKKLSQTGYQAGGGAKYVKHLKDLLR